jgi:hypothetical protein
LEIAAVCAYDLQVHSRRVAIVAALSVSCLAGAGSALATSPWTLEELYSQPWPTGNGVRHVAVSDDGAYMACAWDAESESIYDLWVYDLGAESWSQYTDLWPTREAHLRRRFARELEVAREEWQQEREQQLGDEDGPRPEVEGERGQNGDEKHQQAFDEQDRIEEFEKDLLKQWDTFAGVSEIQFLRGRHELAYVFEGRVFSLDLDDPAPAPRERLHT